MKRPPLATCRKAFLSLSQDWDLLFLEQGLAFPCCKKQNVDGSLSKSALALATSLLVQPCCWILLFNIWLALYSCLGCSFIFLALISKVKKTKPLKQWSQIPFRCSAFHLRAYLPNAGCFTDGNAEHFTAQAPWPWLWTNVSQCWKSTECRTFGSLGRSRVVTFCSCRLYCG